MPSNIVIRNLTPETKMGNESPKIATRSDLRDGARGNSGGQVTPGAQITVTGSGFGAPPNIVLLRSFGEGVEGQQIQSTAPNGESGTLSSISAEARYAEFLGRKVFAGFDNSVKQAVAYVHGSDFNRFRSMFSVAVPDGSYFPGTNQPRSLVGANQASIWKLNWFMKEDRGDADAALPDLCAPTVVGEYFVIGGNATSGSYTRFIGPGNSAGGQWAWNSFNTFSMIFKPDIAAPVTASGYLNLMLANENGVTELERSDVSPMLGTAPATYNNATAFFDRWKINPWHADVEGFPEQGYFSDLYLAVESAPGSEDFVQCALLGDAPIFQQCTVLRPVRPDVWEDSLVSFPNPYGLPYYHIVKPDNSVVSGSAP